jgi:hypothetical protein
MGLGGRKPDLRVVIPPSSKGMMPPLVSRGGAPPPQGAAPAPAAPPGDLSGLIQAYVPPLAPLASSC